MHDIPSRGRDPPTSPASSASAAVAAPPSAQRHTELISKGLRPQPSLRIGTLKRWAAVVHLWGMEARLEAEDGSAPARLMERVARRDRDALTELVVAHDADIVRFCYLISGDAELARDATQNAWFRLWSRPPRLRDPGRLRSWLLSVAANEARQMMRRRGIGRVRELQVTPAAAAFGDPAASDTQLDVRALVSRLDAGDRELLALRYAVGMSSAQIGAHLGITAEGARTRLHRLLERLRRELVNE